MFIAGSSPPSPPSPFFNSTPYCLLWQTGRLRSKRLRPAAYVLPQLHNILPHSNPRPFAGNLEGHEDGADEDMMTGDLLYPNPMYPNHLYPTINSAQQQLYPTQYCYPTRPGAYPQPQLPPPPGLGFSPHPHYLMANAMYPYPPAPAPAPAPASSDKAGTRQRGKKQGKQGNKTPPKEKTGTLTPPSIALLSCVPPRHTSIATTMAG
jgi:hypothetical protein